MAEPDELKIPKTMWPIAEEVIGITDGICAKLLDSREPHLTADEAFQRGYIPYIPALGPEVTAALMEGGDVPQEHHAEGSAP